MIASTWKSISGASIFSQLMTIIFPSGRHYFVYYYSIIRTSIFLLMTTFKSRLCINPEKYFWGQYFLPAHDNHIPVRPSLLCFLQYNKRKQKFLLMMTIKSRLRFTWKSISGASIFSRPMTIIFPSGSHCFVYYSIISPSKNSTL